MGQRVRRIGIILAVLVFSSAAHAADPAAAETLFREGRTLLSAGQLDAACRKFEDSQALDASSGTLLNLAACHAKQGKTATAWAEFLAASRLARTQGRSQHEAEGKKRAAELEPQLSYLTIEVPEPVPGLEVRRGAEVLQPGMFGSSIPVDPGEHRIVANAPGFKPAQEVVIVLPRRDRKVVTLPRLQEEERASPRRGENVESSPPVHAAVETANSASSNPIPATTGSANPLPWITGAVGVGALVTGSVFGVLALKSNSDAKSLCDVPSACLNPSALSAADRRDTQATIANVAIGAGLVALGVTTWMIIAHGGASEPARPAKKIRVDVGAHGDKPSLWVSGTF